MRIFVYKIFRMVLLMLVLVTLAVWFAIGYLFWCAIQYGTIKFWYITYKEDYRQSSPARAWVKSLPVICAAGPLNLLIAPFSGILKGISFKHGITIYFKVPPGTPLCNG